MINKIKIFGERCSGTNYLEKLLIKNLRGVTVLHESQDFGWKHNIVYQENWSSLYDVLFLYIYRNPYDWLRSLYLQPHHMPQMKELSFLDFLQANANVYEGNEMIDSSRNVFQSRAVSIVDALHLRNKVPNMMIISYEDLNNNPQMIFEIAKKYQLSMREDFVNINTYKGIGEKYQPKQYEELPDEIVTYIKEHLDWDLEEKLLSEYGLTNIQL